MKLDSSSCDAKFPASELASSIVNIIKDAVRTVPKDGVVNIYIHTVDKNNKTNVLSEKIVLTTTTEAPQTTEVPQTTEAPNSTETPEDEILSIANEPDYVELEVNEPI